MSDDMPEELLELVLTGETAAAAEASTTAFSGVFGDSLPEAIGPTRATQGAFGTDGNHGRGPLAKA
jgi:hypothetical protein